MRGCRNEFHGFREVSIETKKDYQLGTYKKFGNEINLNKLDSIPANYSSISWRIKDKRKKTIPYFDLKKANSTYIQIIESVVNYYDHCTTDRVADELLYYLKNGEDPSAFFVAKVFMYMSQMDSLEIESRNEIITTIENADNEIYQEIDKSNIPATKPKRIIPQRNTSERRLIDNRILNTTVEELNLTVRSYNCLKRAGYNTVKDIIKKASPDLIKIRNLGRRGQEEIVRKIHSLGLLMANER